MQAQVTKLLRSFLVARTLPTSRRGVATTMEHGSRGQTTAYRRQALWPTSSHNRSLAVEGLRVYTLQQFHVTIVLWDGPRNIVQIKETKGVRWFGIWDLETYKTSRLSPFASPSGRTPPKLFLETSKWSKLSRFPNSWGRDPSSKFSMRVR